MSNKNNSGKNNVGSAPKTASLDTLKAAAPITTTLSADTTSKASLPADGDVKDSAPVIKEDTSAKESGAEEQTPVIPPVIVSDVVVASVADVADDLVEEGPALLSDAVTAPLVQMSLLERHVIETVDSYAAYMAPGVTRNWAEIGTAHNSIFLMLQRVLSADEEFVTCFELLLKKIAEYRTGAFGEGYIFRGTDKKEIGFSKANVKFFSQIFGLLIRICDPGARQIVLKQYNLAKGLDQVTNEKWRQKIYEHLAVGQ